MKFRNHDAWNGFIIGGKYYCNYYNTSCIIQPKRPKSFKDSNYFYFQNDLYGENAYRLCVLVKIDEPFHKLDKKIFWISKQYISIKKNL